MKEYTVTYNAQITEIITGNEELEKALMSRTEKDMALVLKCDTGADDVVVSDYKVFARETSKDRISNNTLNKYNNLKSGSKVWIVERECEEAVSVCGYLYLATVGNAVIVTPFINDFNYDETLEYLITETEENMYVELNVYPLEDCYVDKFQANEVLKKESMRDDR